MVLLSSVFFLAQVGRISSQASDLLREVLQKALQLPNRRVSTQQPWVTRSVGPLVLQRDSRLSAGTIEILQDRCH